MCFLTINGEVGYGSPTEFSLGGQNAKFQIIGRELKFGPNHRWVNCNLTKSKILKCTTG